MSLFFDFPINYRTDLERNFSGSGATRTAITSIADNNYNTSSDATTFTFKTHQILASQSTQITHVFVKCSGVVSYEISVPTGMGTGTTETRTLPSTVNNAEGEPISITVGDWQNDLFKLTAPFNATEVQIIFTGTDVKIAEVMLLNLVLDFPQSHYFEITPTKTDRRGGLHENTSGGITRFSAANGRRSKWSIDYDAQFTAPYGYRDLLDFFERYDNFVFEMEYSRYPDRVFPAVFENFDIELSDATPLQEHLIETAFTILES